MNDARRLYQLQEIDLEMEISQETLTRILSQMGEDSVLKEAAAAREQARRWLRELERAQRGLEADAEDMRAKLQQVENKLYSGKVTNLKELSSLQEEFEQLKAKIRRQEDRVLGVMGEVEAAQKSLQLAEQSYNMVEAQWHQQQEALAGERSILEATLAQRRERRGKLAGEVAPSNLGVYEGLRVPKQVKAVARVEQGRCQGCRLSLSLAELNLARGSGLVQCSSCHRILCLD